MITCHKTTLPNGLRVVAVEMPHLHSAEIAIYIRVGGRNDSLEKAGVSHFLEHMLFRGTEEHPTTLELETAFEAIGGNVNAATDAETTCYYSRIHPDHLSEGVRLLSVMVLKPTFNGIEIEKRIITEEALEDLNEQGEEINTDNLSSRLLWPGHPLGMPTIGFLDTINALTVDDLRRHMEQYYVPANALIVAAGRISATELFPACESAFGGWKGGDAPQLSLAGNSQTAPQAIFVQDSDSQVSLQVAFRSFPRTDPRLMATRIIRRAICGGGSSRLHLLLREKLGIVYSVDANVSAYDETGCFAIELSTAPENLIIAVTEVLKETLRLSVEPMSREELNKVRDSYLFDLEFSRDSTFDLQVRYGWGELMGMVRSIEEDREEAASVDPETVLSSARAIFAPNNLNLVAVGPAGEEAKKAIAVLLAQYEKDFGEIR